MDYEKKYNEALKRAKAAIDIAADKDLVKGVATTIFPELRESEDERIRKKLYNTVMGTPNDSTWFDGTSKEAMLAWLEKQKEPKQTDLPAGFYYIDLDGNKYYSKEFRYGDMKVKVGEQKPEELAYRLNGLMQEYIKEGEDEDEKEHRLKCYKLFWDALEDTSYFEQKEQKPPVDVDPCDASWDAYYQRGLNKGYELGLEAGRKEQKPNSTEDMPYVADEHFFERTPVDSFKYRLAEYMTKNCKKGEGPYGYSYNISSESILEMAKDELIKRGELKEQQPAWSEEDEKILKSILWVLESYVSKAECEQNQALAATYPTYYKEIDWLKSLRPQWKPTEEQMKALNWARCLIFETYTDKHIATEPYHILGELYDQLKQLKDGTDRKD